MNKLLICDTETSNLTTKNVVQLAAILVENNHIKASLNLIIKPDGWTIDPKAEAVHGISMETAERYGVPIEAALWLFDCLSEQADVVICHNTSFDIPVITAEYRRLNREWIIKESYCTMQASRDVVKIPPTEKMIRAGFRQYKSPSLMEAHQYLLGCGFENSHSAMADVEAAWAVYKELQKLKV